MSAKTQELSFQLIENSLVILNKSGVQSQHEAYLRRGEVFAKMGSGFVGLRRSGTSKQGVTLVDYDLGGENEYSFTGTGRIVLRDHHQAHEDCDGYLISRALPEPTEMVTAKKRTRKK